MDQVPEGKTKGPNVLLVGAGTMFTAMVISGFLVGYVIDELAGTRPFTMLACGVLGMIGGMMKVHEMTAHAEGALGGPRKNNEQQDGPQS